MSDKERIWPSRDDQRQFGRDMRDVARGTYEPSPWVREQMEEIEQSQREHDAEVERLWPKVDHGPRPDRLWWRNDDRENER